MTHHDAKNRVWTSIFIYVVVLLVVFAALYIYMRLTWWSSLNLALVAGMLVLLSICPPTTIKRDVPVSYILLYGGIFLLTFLIFSIYIISRALSDSRDKVCTLVPV